MNKRICYLMTIAGFFTASTMMFVSKNKIQAWSYLALAFSFIAFYFSDKNKTSKNVNFTGVIYDDDFVRLIKDDDKIKAVKRCRKITGCDLKTANDFVNKQ